MKTTAKQRTIVDTELYNKINAIWNNASENEVWNCLFDKQGGLENSEIPFFKGGLDHIEKKNNGFWFFDIGSNHGCNTFCIAKKSDSVTAKDIIIISGEGSGQGTVEKYHGTGSIKALRRRYNKEICGGDRWCKIMTASRESEFNPVTGYWE